MCPLGPEKGHFLSYYQFPSQERCLHFLGPCSAANVFMFLHSPGAGIEVFEILFFSYHTKHLRSDIHDVYSHLVLKIKASVFAFD